MVENFRIATEEGKDVAYMETRIEKYLSKKHTIGFNSSTQNHKELTRIFNYTGKKGIQWDYKGQEISLFNEENRLVYGFPSLDLKYVVAIYYESKVFPEPHNLVIHNADGSIHKHITEFPKKMLSQKYKGMRSQFLLLEYTQFLWQKDLETQEYKNCIKILVNRTQFEDRELIIETGEFGKLLSEEGRP